MPKEKKRLLDGILLDLDGTLLDSAPFWQAFGRWYLSGFGLSLSPEQEKRISAMTLAASAEWMAAHFPLQKTVAQVRADWDRLLRAYYETQAVLFPGAATFLHRAAACGLRLGLLTQTPLPFAEAALRRAGVRDCFTQTESEDSMGLSKTKAEIYRRACRRLGTAGSRTILIDDSLPALRAAKTAGLSVCRFCGSNLANRERLISEDLPEMTSWNEEEWSMLLSSEEETPKKVFREVVAALICKDGRYLVFQRPASKARGLLWEFVGGKVEAGETKQEALMRECREELAAEARPGEVFMEVDHSYPDITIHLTLFRTELAVDRIRLLEHAAMRWLTPDEMRDYPFCPADQPILEKLQNA